MPIPSRPKIARGHYMGDVPLDVLQRLIRRLVHVNGDCWIWTGAADQRGYGYLKVEGVCRWAHRVAFAAFKGPLKGGLEVHHTCHNTRCCNPAHLEALPANRNRSRRRT